MSQSIARHSQCNKLAEALIAGSRVGIYLKPSAEIRRRGGVGSYIEFLKLPHAIIQGSHVWCFQERHQASHVRGKSFDGFGYFAYTNAADLFANVVFDSRIDCMKDPRVNVQLMSTGRYQELVWRIKTDTRLVWSSNAPLKLDAYKKAINAGADFHMVLQNENGNWHVHPIHYPFLLETDDSLHIQTHSEMYPSIFESSTIIEEIGRRSPNMLNFDDIVGREEVLRMSAQASSTYISARGGGRYYGLFDIFKEEDRRYRTMKIYARD